MKRIISFILVFAMAISLLPAISFAAEEGETVTYSLVPNGETDKGKTLDVFDYTSTNNMWKYFGTSDSSVETITGYDSRCGYYLRVSGAVSNWVAIKINIADAGKYNIAYNYSGTNGNGTNYPGDGSVHIFPGDTSLANISALLEAKSELAYSEPTRMTSNYRAGSIPLTTRDSSADIELASGEYVVVFYVASAVIKNDGNIGRIYPLSLDFKLVEKAALRKYKLIPGKVILSADEKTSLSLVAPDGETVDAFDIKEISTSDESIATADSTKITAVGTSFGRVKISATVVVGGKEQSAEGFVRVVNEDDSGERIAHALDTRFANSAGEIWVNPSYAKYPEHYTSVSRGRNDIGGVDPGDGITADYTDGWSFYGYDEDVKKTEMTFHQSSGNFFRTGIGAGQWLALKLDIPKAGHYRAMLNHIAYNALGNGAVYLIPIPDEGETVEEYLTDAYKLGDFSCYDENITAWNAEGAARSTYLGEGYADKAGEHLLVIENTGGKSLLFINDIILSGANPIAGVSASLEKAIAVGDTVLLGADIITWENVNAEYSENYTVTYANSAPDVLSVSDDGTVTAIAPGTGIVTIKVTWKDYSVTEECAVVVGSGKTRRSYYTDEKVKNLRNNISRYEWAQDERDKYVEEADKLLTQGIDKLYNMITTQELPRASTVAYRFNDNGQYTCVYCDKDLYTDHGARPWDMDVFTRPWKIQCPECKRLFPSNDFGRFYELGIDEHGNYRFELALQRHHEKFVCANGEACECEAPEGERGSDAWNSYYGYGVEGGYLYNNTYKEKNDPFFAIDDGWGYEYTYTYTNADGTPVLNEDGSVKTEARCKPFIGFYNMWGLWESEIQSWITNLSMAYLYTDDAKYGRAAAILVDRIADVFPEFDTTECGYKFLVNDGNTIKWKNGTTTGTSRGKIMGRLHDNALINVVAFGYDAVFPMLSDGEVISYLSGKAEEYNMENRKQSAVDIARNVENNFLREAHSCFLDYRISGNFGVPEKAHLVTAVVIDTLPETEEWINWVFQSGYRKSIYEYTGGNVYSQLVTVGKVDRDGHGNEASPGYNGGWINNMISLADILNDYDKIDGVNLYEHPKMIRMLTSELDIICVSTTAPNIGDHDRMGRHLPGTSVDALLTAYNVIEDEETRENIARAIYLQNGKKTDNLHSSIFDAEPEAAVKAIEKIVSDGHLAVKLGSRALGGYGISILRAGDWYIPNDESNNVNTQRDFYLWYGQTDGHGNFDKLNLGFHAYGLDIGADIGETHLKDTTNPHRTEMCGTTVAHNTVTVNNVSQKATLDGNIEHFDDAGRVKVMDAEAPEVYVSQGVDEYKRTLVMVDANDDISYAVDFFHILGGEDHLYSFHSLATEAELSDNVAVQSQKDDNGNYIGSYQGIDKAWGGSTIKDDSDGLGTYSWFGEVDRATEPGNADVFSMDWKIVDNDKVLKPAQKDLRVRLTMLNSFKLDEITTTSGIPPQVYNALPKVRFLFARHTGENDGLNDGEKLDTLFTSVVEPYNKTRYIQNIEKVDVTRADGAEFTMDEAKAVKVTLTNGRVDYIVYAKDKTVPYKVHYKTSDGSDASFGFCGFVGVVSMVNDRITYTYVNDGTTIADKEGLIHAYEGEVTAFQTKLDTDNWMDINFGGDIEYESLAGRYVYVDNGLSDNAAYRIESAAPSSENEGSIRLSLGNTTLITSYVDDYDFDKGFNYNIKVTDKARIPLSYVEDNAPVIAPVSDSLATSAGSSIKVSLSVTAESTVTYSAASLPRGASLNSATGEITWKPDDSQVGEKLFMIDVTDEEGRVSRTNFTVEVYGRTTGSTSSDTTETPSTGASGGGGGGGAAPDTGNSSDTTVGDGGSDVPSDDDSTQPDVGSGVHDEPKFVDLGNHEWAADAINTLADDGIIKGTTYNTYSPSNNITRADFALLLVRAFKLESDNTENFADVTVSDYFAPELAIARNTGIVQGIGNNLYAPRNTITRQDMMVITYRALQTLSVAYATALPEGELSDGADVKSTAEGTSVEEYADFTTVADYAREAVTNLIGAGIVNGKNDIIAPTDYTTRAEVAVLIKRILDYVK